jgi:hypothetical protein
MQVVSLPFVPFLICLSLPQIIPEMFGEFEELGLIDGYESVIASLGYECIEAHVLETCTGPWGNTMFDVLRSWMSEKVVPWMLVIYARGAATGGSFCFVLRFFGGC